MRTLAKMVKLNFPRTLEITQFAAIQGAFTQHKWWNLSQNSELCGTLTWPSPKALCPPYDTMRTEACGHGENQQPGSLWVELNGTDGPPIPHSQLTHYLACLTVPWKMPLTRFVSI